MRAAAAAFVLLAGPAAAFELKLWPLVRWRSDPEAGVVHVTALGPLVEYLRTPDVRDLRVRPLLWLTARREPREDRLELLFPLASARREPGHRTVRVLLASGHAAEGGTRGFTLLPFVFWREPAPDAGRLGVLPFYLDAAGLFGFDEVQAIAFPLWLRLRSGGVERRFHPFPFVSTVRGVPAESADAPAAPGAGAGSATPAGGAPSGLRVWPLFGVTDVPGREHTRYVLWPFWIDQERWVPGYGPERRRVRVPVWAALDGAWRTSRGLGVLGYTHTVDRRIGSEAVGSPWPLVLRERALGEETWRTFRVAPFWGRSDDGRLRSRFWLWPLYRATDQDEDDFHARRRDLLLILGRLQWQWDEATGAESALQTLVPAVRNVVQDGRAAGQAPALVDALVPRNRGVLALWAPLWGLVRWETRPDGVLDWSVLWGLVAREAGRLRGPVRLAG